MAQLFRNNAFSALGASLTNAATTLTVTTGHGDRFPAVAAPDFFMLTLQDASNNIEIVRVTARTAGSASMTIVRAQEGTTARAWNIGDVVELRLTAFALNPLGLLEGASTAGAIRDALDLPTRTGSGASGTWNINISGNAATATQATNAANAAACSGNSATATALQTGRTFTIGGTGKSFNATSNLSWTLAEIGAPSTAGAGASGTWNISISGNAATANALNAANNYTISQRLWFGVNSQSVYAEGGSNNIGFLSAGGGWLFRSDDSGNVVATGNVTAFSDERLKKDWAPVAPDFLERLAFVRHGTYTRTDTGERQAGVSAQDMQRLLAEAVGENSDGFLSLAYGNAALVAAVKLAERVLELEARMKALEG